MASALKRGYKVPASQLNNAKTAKGGFMLHVTPGQYLVITGGTSFSSL